MFKKISRWFRRPKDPAGHIYYVKLKTPQGIFYKLGYTSKASLVERMAYGNTGDEKLIDREFFFTFFETAWDLEQNLLEYFQKYRTFGRFSNDPNMPLSGRGQSELFDRDILGLDDDLYKPVGEDLLKAIQEDQNDAAESFLLMLLGIVLFFFAWIPSLLFILGGGSGIFGTKPEPLTKIPARPVHPESLQNLINDLVRYSKHRSDVKTL